MVIARDIMTTEVVSVRAETPIREVAALLSEKRISAVPVLDEHGSPIGMVSEGDLIGRDLSADQARRDWWLEILAEGEPLSPDFIASLRPAGATAGSKMSVPVITIEETTEIGAIAQLLEEYRIKRVPVVRDGRAVGIVSRADLVRALAASSREAEHAQPSLHGLAAAISALDHHFRGIPAPEIGKTPVAPATPINAMLSAERFRETAAQYRNREHQHHEEAERAVALHLHAELKELSDHHVDDGYWEAILAKALEAAQRGEKEYLVLRFPHALCSDDGRAINAPLPDWPKTLRGEAAEIYLRWYHDLKSHGFHMTARVLEFPHGFPGDIGLFLSWAD
jgi:CBS domain-containing protein